MFRHDNVLDSLAVYGIPLLKLWQSYPTQFMSVSVSWPSWGNHRLIIFSKPWDNKSNNDSRILLSMRKIKNLVLSPIVCFFYQLIEKRILDRVGSMCNNIELRVIWRLPGRSAYVGELYVRNTKYYSLSSLVESKKEIQYSNSYNNMYVTV